MLVSDLVRDGMGMTSGFLERLMTGLEEKPLAVQSEKGGNSVAWTLGHLCVVEAGIYSMITGEPHELEAWETLFGMGSEPRADGAGYPAVEELRSTYQRLREQNVGLIEKLGEAGMGKKPAFVPPGFEKEMKTVGHTLMILSMHQMMHHGQLADIRREAGLRRFV